MELSTLEKELAVAILNKADGEDMEELADRSCFKPFLTRSLVLKASDTDLKCILEEREEINRGVYVTESDIEFGANELGSQTSGYHFKCYDGYAIGDNRVLEIKVIYPKLAEIGEVFKEECMSFRYGLLEFGYNIHFGDIMLYKGKLESFKVL